jgi:quinol monooxygenase YgiN
MIGAIARLKVLDGKGPEFEVAFAALAARVRADEPGNELYRLCRSRENPNEYVVMEIYADQAAVDAHTSSAHFKELAPTLGPFLEPGRPKLEFLDTVD